MTTQPPTPSPIRSPRPASRTPLAFVALAAAGVVAAGVGGYVVQSHRQPRMPTVEASPASNASPAAVPAPSRTATVARTQPAPAVEPARATAEPAAVQPVEAPDRTVPVEAARRRDAEPAPVRPAARPIPTLAAPTAASARTPEPAPAQPMPAADASAVATVSEPARQPAPAEPVAKAPATPEVETFVIPADAVMGLEIEHSISSETAHLEDRVEARVTRDVRGDGNAILIPAGTRVRGEVTVVETGGKFRDRARLGIRFHTLLLGDGQTISIATDPLLREGDNVGRKTSTRIGASAAGGAIIGAIFGGERGAALGAAAGAGAGTAASAASKSSEARFRAGSVVTVRLTAPVSITLEL